MDFFGQQAASRRLSRRLVLLFVVAVIAVVAVVNMIVLTVVAVLARPSAEVYEPYAVVPDTTWLASNPGTVLLTTLLVLGTVGLASLYKTTKLSSGGGAVARSLGGERVSPDTRDPLRRRLLNVVEEMAIASGVPVPEVYVLEQETAINAFAAGHNPANAAVAVTRGTLENLDRDELQGVIAHEFAHILNGDMRLNTRLIGLLFGLIVVAIIGRTMLRIAPRGGGNRKGGGAVALVLLAALAVTIVGHVGLFFGRLIQAAVSRSRESLADASAVQFTRDPTGIRNALVKIGALSQGSRLVDADAQEVSHMLFAPGVRQLFASHPPLVDRIRAIDARFDPREFEAVRSRLLASRQRTASEAAAESSPDAAERLKKVLGPAVVVAPAAVAELVGNPGNAEIRAAEEIRASLPDALLVAASDPAQARALFLALSLESKAEVHGRQLAFLERELGDEVAAAVRDLASMVDALQPRQRMPALLRLLPTLHRLGRGERARLLAFLNALLVREGPVSVYFYALRKLAQVQLRDELERRGELAGNRSLEASAGDLQVLFSVLAAHGHADTVAARVAYDSGLQQLLPRQRPEFAPPTNWPAALDAALNRLDRLAPAGKQLLVEALTRTIAHDQKLSVPESELLRAICATLHCPLPPLLGAGSAVTQA